MSVRLAAVEADIQRLLPLVPYWPSRFSDVSDARDHVDRVARWKQFAFTPFEGVPQQKFRGYVVFNTVRRAFEEGGFGMDIPGEGWRCRWHQFRGQEKKLEAVTTPKTPVRRFATMRGMSFPLFSIYTTLTLPNNRSHRIRHTPPPPPYLIRLFLASQLPHSQRSSRPRLLFHTSY
jgi:hypothetical protein